MHPSVWFTLKVRDDRVYARTQENGRKLHCGVLEFIATEGTALLPHWVRNPCPAAALGHILHAVQARPRSVRLLVWTGASRWT